MANAPNELVHHSPPRLMGFITRAFTGWGYWLSRLSAATYSLANIQMGRTSCVAVIDWTALQHVARRLGI